MKKLQYFNTVRIIGMTLLSLSAITNAAEVEHPSYTVKPVFGEYQDWSLLAVSHREDKKTLRAILGNDAAIAAARHGHTNPWPDGAVLAKVVWKESTHPNWPQAIVPGTFEKAEAMIKDSKKYATTGGWGFAYWEGKKLIMHEEAKAKECFACHAPMKAHDYVYTTSVLQ
jgi:Cytochrome P460